MKYKIIGEKIINYGKNFCKNFNPSKKLIKNFDGEIINFYDGQDVTLCNGYKILKKWCEPLDIIDGGDTNE